MQGRTYDMVQHLQAIGPVHKELCSTYFQIIENNPSTQKR